MQKTERLQGRRERERRRRGGGGGRKGRERSLLWVLYAENRTITRNLCCCWFSLYPGWDTTGNPYIQVALFMLG
jgi:hypothetical protein